MVRMLARLYLRASTSEQDAGRARAMMQDFAKERGLKIAATYIENESGSLPSTAGIVPV